MEKIILSICLFCFLVTCTAYASGHGDQHAAGPAVTPQKALQDMVEGNDAFVKAANRESFKKYANAQHPFVTMITCSDARVHPTIFNFDPIDNVFVIRNVGNQIYNSCGSIDYGVYHLHTPILLILGHTHCGAVKAAMGDYANESTCIKNELDGLHLPLMWDDGQGTFEQRWLDNVERNVDFQVKYCVKKYHDLIAEGKLAVVGAVYDFLNAYGHGEGRVVITNMNGVVCPNAIKASPAMAGVAGALKDVVVDRKTDGR